jgi:MSHA pilin protein MshC
MAGCNRKPAHVLRREAHSGFTIVELVAVISIMAILAAFAAPSFSVNQPLVQRGYADEIANALRQARNVAVASDCDVRFSINLSGYQALQRAAGAPCQTSGGFVTTISRGDSHDLSGFPPAGANVNAASTIVFTGGTGEVSGGAPPATVVGAFTIAVAADGWVQVQ